MNLRVQFHGMPHSAKLQTECQGLADALIDEFPEVLRCEVTLGVDAGEHQTHVHVTGKEIDYSAHARSEENIFPSITDAFEKARRQLRKHHDKMTLGRRRRTPREA